jgi:hypothetical protein
MVPRNARSLCAFIFANHGAHATVSELIERHDILLKYNASSPTNLQDGRIEHVVVWLIHLFAATGWKYIYSRKLATARWARTDLWPFAIPYHPSK